MHHRWIQCMGCLYSPLAWKSNLQRQFHYLVITLLQSPLFSFHPAMQFTRARVNTSSVERIWHKSEQRLKWLRLSALEWMKKNQNESTMDLSKMRMCCIILYDLASHGFSSFRIYFFFFLQILHDGSLWKLYSTKTASSIQIEKCYIKIVD